MKTLRQHIRKGQLRPALDRVAQTWANALADVHQAIKNNHEPPTESDYWLNIGPSLSELLLPVPEDRRGCPLLTLAVSDGGAEFKKSLEQLSRHCESTRQTYEGLDLTSLECRLDLLQLWLAHRDGSRGISVKLKELASQYSKLWSLPVWNFIDATTKHRSAAYHRLTSLADHSTGPSAGSNWASMIDGIAQQQAIRWMNPTVAFIAESLLWLNGGSLPNDGLADDVDGFAEIPGRTWVLLVGDNKVRTTPEPFGMLLRLDIDVVENGCGAFYPDARFPYIAAADSFQMSLRNAWNVMLSDQSQDSQKRRQDYRWRLTVIDDSHHSDNVDDWHRLRRHLLVHPLQGRSGEAAITAALRSAIERVPLDLGRAASAMFEEELPATVNPALTPIGGVTEKKKQSLSPNRHLIGRSTVFVLVSWFCTATRRLTGRRARESTPMTSRRHGMRCRSIRN